MTDSLHKFAIRKKAGRALADELSQRKIADPVVLALPHGGLAVAFEGLCRPGRELTVV